MKQWTQTVLTVRGRRISHSWWGIKAPSTRFYRHVFSGRTCDTQAVDTETVYLGILEHNSGEGDYAAGLVSEVSIDILIFFSCQENVLSLAYILADKNFK